jgi:ligand-binding SRPBCC domain-containing protein
MEFHVQSRAHAGERVIHRPDHALLQLGEEVEFEGRHFGLRQRLRARIDVFYRPHHFRDVMIRGPFRSFAHDHSFEPTAAGTIMRDRVQFAAPIPLLGLLIERAILRPYLHRLLRTRASEIKQAAERGPDPSVAQA